MRFVILLLLLFIDSSTAKYRILPSVRPKSAIDRLNIHNIADMHNIPQNTSYYAKQILEVSWNRQLKDAKHYRAPLIIGNTHNGQCKCKIVQEIYES